MGIGSTTRTLYHVLSLVVVYTARAEANKYASFESKNATFYDPTEWKLVPKGNQDPITSLSDLEDGVFAVQLSGERVSACGGGATKVATPGAIQSMNVYLYFQSNTRVDSRKMILDENALCRACRIPWVQQQDMLYQNFFNIHCWPSHARSQHDDDVARVDDSSDR